MALLPLKSRKTSAYSRYRIGIANFSEYPYLLVYPQENVHVAPHITAIRETTSTEGKGSGLMEVA